MKAYMGTLLGLRFYTLPHSSEAKFLVGGRRTKWYSPRQRAKHKSYPIFVGSYRRDASPTNPHNCPCPGELCGINAYDILSEEARKVMTNDVSGMHIAALCMGHGRVITMTDHREITGWRAQRVEVIGLVSMSLWGDTPLQSFVDRNSAWSHIPVVGADKVNEPIDMLEAFNVYPEELTQIPASEVR